MICADFSVCFVMLAVITQGQDILFPNNEDSDDKFSHNEDSVDKDIESVWPGTFPTTTTEIPTSTLSFTTRIKNVLSKRKTTPKPVECPSNMMLFSGEGPGNSSVCDCKTLFVYFEENKACYEVFKRGPCPKGSYVYLKANATRPHCMRNSCDNERLVPFKGGCHELKKLGGVCGDSSLGVNQDTLQLECVQNDLNPLNIIQPPQRNCSPGSRRNSQGVCKVIL